MSGQIGEAFVRVRAVGGPEFSRSLNQQTAPALQKFSRQVHQAEQGVGRFSRGALIGTGALHSFGRAAVFASTTLLGGYGLTFALRKSLDAARDNQIVQGQLSNAVHSAGLEYGVYRHEINKALAATEALGFSSDETGRSYATLIRTTRDVTKSTRDQALAANIARATNRSLEQATRAVAQAEAGRAGALQRLLPGIEKGVTAEKSLAEATRITAGAAVKYGDTFAGSQDKLNAAISRTEVTIGNALIPTVTILSNRLSDWLDKSENQKRIQDDVNKAVKIGGEVAHDLAGGLHAVETIAKPLVDTLGGLGNTVELLVTALAAKKVLAFAGALRLVGTAATTAATEVAAAETTISGFASVLGPLGLAVGGGYLLGKAFEHGPYSEAETYKFVGRGGMYAELAKKALAKAGLPGALTFLDVYPALKAGLLDVAGVRQLKIRFASDFDYQGALTFAQGTAKAAQAAQGALGRAMRPEPGMQTGPTPLSSVSPDIASQTNLARAQASGSPSAIKAAAQARLEVIKRQIAFALKLEGRRGKTAELENALQGFYGDQANTQGIIDQINQAAVDKAAAKAAEAARKLKAAADREKAAREAWIRILDQRESNRQRDLDKWGRRAITNAKATVAKQLALRDALTKTSDKLFGSRGAKGGKAGAAGGYTLDQLFAEAGAEFALYGGNLGPGPLSPQDARGQLGGIIGAHKTQQTTVVQNFYGDRNAAQGIQDAYRVARNMK